MFSDILFSTFFYSFNFICWYLILNVLLSLEFLLQLHRNTFTFSLSYT